MLAPIFPDHDARPAGLVDEVADEVIGEVAEVVGRDHRVLVSWSRGWSWTLVMASIRSSRRTEAAMGVGFDMRQPYVDDLGSSTSR